MKQILAAALAALVVTWSAGSFAGDVSMRKVDEPRSLSPESIVTCATGSGQGVEMQSVPIGFDVSACVYAADCATCITSLEAQGCRYIDAVVTHVAYLATSTTYLMSCVEP